MTTDTTADAPATPAAAEATVHPFDIAEVQGYVLESRFTGYQVHGHTYPNPEHAIAAAVRLNTSQGLEEFHVRHITFLEVTDLDPATDTED